jgi:hypothetical protein
MRKRVLSEILESVRFTVARVSRPIAVRFVDGLDSMEGLNVSIEGLDVSMEGLDVKISEQIL